MNSLSKLKLKLIILIANIKQPYKDVRSKKLRDDCRKNHKPYEKLECAYCYEIVNPGFIVCDGATIPKEKYVKLHELLNEK